MNKKSLLLALITGTAPLIAQETPSQVLESLMQPLPSVAANIQAREAAFPALRQIPSSACAFMSMADVQGNITKLLNNKLIMAASEGESAELIANIPPIESIAISFEQGAEPNLNALITMCNNFNTRTNSTQMLANWKAFSKEDYQASFDSIQQAFDASIAEDILAGVNKTDINLPEMRITVSMKSGSEALVAQLKQLFDTHLAELPQIMPIPMPVIKQDGYTVISLPLAMGAAMIPELPAGSIDAIVKSQHYLAVKFEGNSISVVYSRDLKKINAPSSIEQSMLASDKLKLSDARLSQGIVGASFVNAKFVKLISDYDYYTGNIELLQSTLKALAGNHGAQAPVFNAAALAAEQVGKQIIDLQEQLRNQAQYGELTSVTWCSDKLSYEASYDYSNSSWNYKSSKLNAWNQIDQSETISYISISPMISFNLDFDSKALEQDAKTIGKAISLTLDNEASTKLNRVEDKLAKYSEKIATAAQALSDIYDGTEGSITIYADNKGNAEDIFKNKLASKIFSAGKAPRATVFRAVSDKSKVDAGVKALLGICDKGAENCNYLCSNDRFISFGNSAALNQSSLSQSSSIKEFAGVITYFNPKAFAPIIKDEKAKEILQLVPALYSVTYLTDNTFVQIISIK